MQNTFLLFVKCQVLDSIFCLRKMWICIGMYIFLQGHVWSQEYYFDMVPDGLCKLQLGIEGCSCNIDIINNDYMAYAHLAFSPDSTLLSFKSLPNNGWVVHEVDLVTGDTTFFFEFDPMGPDPTAGYIVSVGNGIFYYMQWTSMGNDSLWKMDMNDGTITHVGNTGFPARSDLALFNGEVYYFTYLSGNFGIVKVDLVDPSNSTLIVNTTPSMLIFNLTASPFCNTLLCQTVTPGENDVNFSLVSLIDGSITHICQGLNSVFHLTSMLEFAAPTFCDNTLDLDCNDSSGATDADYNSSVVTCLMRQTTVADEDVRMFYDAIISEMTIRITGFMPDGLNEVIDITGSVPGIDVSGQGTDILTLSNAGSAKSTDFIDALHLVRYMNTALNPTAGPRTIEVQFTTESGGMSNVAIAYIQVNAIPPLVVDIGPDQMMCEGSTASFDAGSFPGGTYQWASGQMTQSITTSLDGQYMVTVSDATHCPGADTAILTTIPLITVALTGDEEICDNQSATLTLNTNAPFPITVEIDADPGSPFIFDDVVGNYSFTDLPQDNTTYTITSVTPSMEACITVTDQDQVIDVYPAYNHLFDVPICDGDSVWLGFYWETEAGVYENTFNSAHGCDSTVTTNISILPAVMIQLQADTCDPAAIGVFITTIDNPSGCDTVVTTTVSLIPADTTMITQSTCVWNQSGTHTDTLMNQAGCDSLIIITHLQTRPICMPEPAIRHR
jgi:hypothetical protein